MTSLTNMQLHISELCERHEIQIEWWRDRKAWATRSWDVISIPPVRSTITYAIALHEMGHILGRHQQSRQVIVRERWAWTWAKQNALRWTPGMEHYMSRSIAWYSERRWPPTPTFYELNPHLRSARDDAVNDHEHFIETRRILTFTGVLCRDRDLV